MLPIFDNIRRKRTLAPVDGLTPLLWLDAAQITGKVDGDAMPTWTDAAGSGNYAKQTNALKQPLYKTNIQRGLPGVLFDGNNDWMQLQTQLVIAGAYTCFAVTQTVDDGIAQIIHNLNGNGMASPYLLDMTLNHAANTAGGSIYDGGAVSASYAGDPTGLNIWAVTAAVNTVVSVYRNGVLKAGTTVSGPAWSTPSGTTGSIGAIRGGTSNFLNGYLFEFIVYDSVLSAVDMARVHEYLSKKWGIPGAGYQPTRAPADLSHVVAWWDALSVHGIDGQTASVVRDMSGNGNHITQVTPAYKPVLQKNVLNGKPGLLFDGTDDWYQLVNKFIVANSASVFGVYSLAAPAPGVGPVLFNFNCDDAGNDYAIELIWDDALSKVIAYSYDTADRNSSITPTTLVGSHFIGYTLQENDFLTLYLDNAVAVPQAMGTLSTPSSIEPGAVGANRDGLSRWITGYLHELIVMDSKATAAEIASVKAYLQTRWGL